jgi:hypothetical protein
MVRVLVVVPYGPGVTACSGLRQQWLPLGQVGMITGDLEQGGQAAENDTLVVCPSGLAVVLARRSKPVIDQAAGADETGGAWKSGSVMSFLAYRSSGSGRSRPPVMADRLSCA